ncbi:MAG: hypothetical protein ACTHJ2_09430 [Candidatus Nitrosocosmicus sp.]
MNEYKVSIQSLRIASNIIEEYQKLKDGGLTSLHISDEAYTFQLIVINLINPIKTQLLDIEDRSERYKLLEAYKILSQISFDMLSKEVMGDN